MTEFVRFETGMPRMLKACACWLSLVLCQVAAQGQDIHFSQFFETPLLRNPSLAGIFTGDYRVQGVYRDQWNSFTNAYRTGSLSAEYKMPVGMGNDYITTALQVLYDKAGTAALNTTYLLPGVNYHKSLSNEKTEYLSLGFMGGVVRKSIDMSKITTDGQYGGGGFDPSLPTGELLNSPSFTTWDASVGLSFNTTFGANQGNSMYAGAAYHHLNRPKNSFYRDAKIELNPKFVISGAVRLAVDDYTYFTVYADQSLQGEFHETIAGALYSYRLGPDPENAAYTLHAGAFLRWKDALVPVLKLDMHSLSVALSYDVNVSQLKTASMGHGGVELSIAYIGFVDRPNSDRDRMLCPRF